MTNTILNFIGGFLLIIIGVYWVIYKLKHPSINKKHVDLDLKFWFVRFALIGMGVLIIYQTLIGKL